MSIHEAVVYVHLGRIRRSSQACCKIKHDERSASNGWKMKSRRYFEFKIQIDAHYQRRVFIVHDFADEADEMRQKCFGRTKSMN